ncbi:MAG: hypothetical protein IPG93_19155 [Burkholderiales bacterium]|nr:hypothetical protein [Burkholderiales bacterium]
MPKYDDERRFRTTLGQAREILEAMFDNGDANDYHFSGSVADSRQVLQQLTFVENNASVARERLARAQTAEGAHQILRDLREGRVMDNVQLNDVVFTMGPDNALLSAWAYDGAYLHPEIEAGSRNFETIQPFIEGATRNSVNGTRCFGEYLYAAPGAKANAGNYTNLLAATLVDPVSENQVEQLLARLETLTRSPLAGVRGSGDAGTPEDSVNHPAQGNDALGEAERLRLEEQERQRQEELERQRLQEEERQRIEIETRAQGPR